MADSRESTQPAVVCPMKIRLLQIIPLVALAFAGPSLRAADAPAMPKVGDKAPLVEDLDGKIVHVSDSPAAGKPLEEMKAAIARLVNQDKKQMGRKTPVVSELRAS
jgi:hypothetical protein